MVTVNAKWTAFSLFGVAVLGAGLAAAGCSVTTGSDNGSSSGTVVTPKEDASTNPDSGADASTYVNTCTTNTRETIGPIVSEACQTSIDTNCCTTLSACFNIVTPSGVDDCNKFTTCIDSCNYQADGVTPETDAKKVEDCQTKDCPALSQQDVVDAYDALTQCILANPSTKSACGL
ncbi:MAG: hypothetical protein JWP97_537 [Labilithrix sp.]|nr:hypothetical protein [Labilithrix sp.]